MAAANASQAGVGGIQPDRKACCQKSSVCHHTTLNGQDRLGAAAQRFGGQHRELELVAVRLRARST